MKHGLLATLAALFVALLLTASAHAQGRVVRVRLGDGMATLNANFPKDYTDRTFIKGLAMYRNKIEDLAGCLILLEDRDKASIIGQYVKSGEPPLKNVALSDVLYSSKISASFKMNGSYMIASVAATTSSVVELIVTDINGVLVPETSIPYLDICRAAKNVDKELKKKIYYIRSAKLTSVHSRAYQEVNAESGVTGTVFSAGGKVYSSSDQFKTDYVVSVDLVSLTNLLLTKNCDNLISSSELASRQQQDRAKQDAERAEQERRQKEGELKSAKAEADDLKKKVAEIQESLKRQAITTDDYRNQVEALRRDLVTAQARVNQVNIEFKQVENNTKVVVANAEQQQAQAKTEGDAKLVQKSDVGVISEVKNLSEEEVKKMGFKDVKP
ncbi:hypothetical protein LJ737_13635 [Hymenobacter sp. 15J16-1T3B]|uniref:hypothetical protein n=1 Tax=Hymenobacter sp. 15J16-1T3B TaxID=2886941 RepID=UPI001D126FFE|nr:hypothetical protein [Hymenobacter sp. 15J16-1T3B]MCC3158285.1 hypothetical protein [Hymenobacter sp. 15J16-1T3B]